MLIDIKFAFFCMGSLVHLAVKELWHILYLCACACAPIVIKTCINGAASQLCECSAVCCVRCEN